MLYTHYGAVKAKRNTKRTMVKRNEYMR